ncbi:MAG: NAD(P)H-dependent oxidoreductase subunit E [Bdellovibrionales bacterium]|nr:NAD(P)H-dependent oxidoreductase subunit E [Bdellovibrionales bacterium]
MFKLSPEGIEFVKKEMVRYETKLSAVIPCLYRVQDENEGWISPECVAYLSRLMDLGESEIYEVLTFYTMFNQKPVKPLHVQVCCNVSCAMQGSRKILEELKKQNNSNVTLSAVECLGSCDTAPVLQINREPYMEKVSLEQITKTLQERTSS